MLLYISTLAYTPCKTYIGIGNLRQIGTFYNLYNLLQRWLVLWDFLGFLQGFSLFLLLYGDLKVLAVSFRSDFEP